MGSTLALMFQRPLLYYITDRKAFPGAETGRRDRLLKKIGEAARAGVDYIQIREKDLSARELESLVREAGSILQQLRTENWELRTALLINSRTDIAFAAGADGVHLRSDDISPQEVKQIWQRSSARAPLIGVSCHSPKQVKEAAAGEATFAVFAPVFEKADTPSTKPAGLAQLQQACQADIPVLALGGITLSNAHSCLKVGAAGIAAIRLFQENDIDNVMRKLTSP
jgi:thiamine-phosphate pyrophosphorylase